MAAREALAEKGRVWSGDVVIVGEVDGDNVDVMGVVVVVVVGWRERREKGREVVVVVLKLLLIVSMLYLALSPNIKKSRLVRTESWIAGPFPGTHTSGESRGQLCTGDRTS